MEFNALDSQVDPKSEHSAQPLSAGNFRNEATAEGVDGSAISGVKLEISLSIPGQPVSPSPVALAVSTRIGADKKLEYLDGLRGIMCLVVLCDHWLMMGYYNRPAPFEVDSGQVSPFFGYLLIRSPLRVFVAGEFAVATFFVLRCPHASAAAATPSLCCLPIFHTLLQWFCAVQSVCQRQVWRHFAFRGRHPPFSPHHDSKFICSAAVLGNISLEPIERANLSSGHFWLSCNVCDINQASLKRRLVKVTAISAWASETCF
jgi:hypothetical protein